MDQDPLDAKNQLPYVFEYASNLKADPKMVFAFHLEPKNISRVSPSWIRVISLESPSPIVEGSKIRLRVASLGIPQSWEVTVREVSDFSGTPGRASILDVADESPFPLWRHLHEFWAAPDGTTGLVDRIEFLPPGAGWDASSCRSSRSFSRSIPCTARGHPQDIRNLLSRSKNVFNGPNVCPVDSDRLF